MTCDKYNSKMGTNIKIAVSICFCFIISVSSTVSNIDVPSPCSPNPCLNSGLCRTNGSSSFSCQCPHGFQGAKCEKPKCPCKHGICKAVSDGSIKCFCAQGYGGKYCDVNLDECASSPCRNGAICIDQVNGYRCQCRESTFGSHCEIHRDDIDKCIADCSGGVCWRNDSRKHLVSWGYGENICNTQHSCFGGQNDSETNRYDTFLEVQMHPLQIQVGDSLNFTTDHSIAPDVEGMIPHIVPVDVLNSSNAFLTCNESDGFPLVNTPQSSILVGSEMLKPGIQYFISNIDAVFRCEFGLRLNVSVKYNKCKQNASEELCSGHGRCFTNFSLPDFRCHCCGGFRGRYCEKIDYCFSTPCKNGGECKNVEGATTGEKHVCLCSGGYEGKDCSIVKDMCESSPCRNGAKCISKINDFTCECPKGYTGKMCEADFDECSSNPCENGGTCVDGINTFYCKCRAGFTGSHCEVDINECASNPCHHGTCLDQENGFKCHCTPGYGGPTCNYNLNECLSNPCKNGGFCRDDVNGYQCECGIGYRGKLCEVDIDLCKERGMCVNSLSCTDKGSHVICECKPGYTGANCAVNINDCASKPCKNGGTCYDKVNGFECKCAPSFSGKTCEVAGETVLTPKISSVDPTHILRLKLMTEDCHLLKGDVVIHDLHKNIASNMAKACECDFSEEHIIRESVAIKCYDSISGEISMEIAQVDRFSTRDLIYKYAEFLRLKKNVINLGHNTFAVDVLSDLSGYSNSKNVKDTVSSRKAEKEKTLQGTSLAVTVASVCAVVCLAAAAVFVCLRCRSSRPPIKKLKSRSEDDLISNLSVDLMSAVAPTPKSLYRTSGGYHNMGYGRFDADNPVKSRRV